MTWLMQGTAPITVTAVTQQLKPEIYPHLIAVVSGEIKPSGLSALDTNVIVVRILDAARESARTGKTIRLADR
jgi:hypothetical protein